MSVYRAQWPRHRGSNQDWTIRTTHQRRERNGAIFTAFAGILCIGVAVWAVIAAGDQGLPGEARIFVLVGGGVAVALIGVCAIATETLARH